MDSASVSAGLRALIRQQMQRAGAGGWLPFDEFMNTVLYTPGLGYYASSSRMFGAMPASGSDFVTAPELSPLFGQTLGPQVLQGLDAAGSGDIWEFGAGSGALAEQLLTTLGARVERYTIIDIAGALRARQQERLARFGNRVQWASALPAAMHGVVLGNEVLDAMPAKLLAYDGQQWRERGVVEADGELCFADRAAGVGPPLRPPFDAAQDTQFPPGSVTEIHPQACAFAATVAQHLQRGLALFFDYGFTQDEYYHPQRTGGTLMCHQGHRSDTNPLVDLGHKDITVHVDFTAIALAAQDAGMDVAGYTSQGRFLLNCGIAPALVAATPQVRSRAQMLVNEHEMGELFKVLALTRGLDLQEPGLLGFVQGDRMHRL